MDQLIQKKKRAQLMSRDVILAVSDHVTTCASDLGQASSLQVDMSGIGTLFISKFTARGNIGMYTAKYI